MENHFSVFLPTKHTLSYDIISLCHCYEENAFGFEFLASRINIELNAAVVHREFARS